MTHRIDRIWLLGGVAVTALLAVVGWFVVIHPQHTDTDAVRQQIAEENIKLGKLRGQLADLEAKRQQLPALLAKLNANLAALPPETTRPQDNSQAAFLNQLQVSGTTLNVDISSLTVGAPIKSARVPAVKEVPITLAIDGKVDDVSQFLLRLQSVQARAVLVTSVGLSAGTAADGSPNSDVTANLTLTAFESATTGSTSLTTK